MEDHNILAVYGLGSDSEDSYGDSSTLPIAKAEELALDQDLADSVRWQDKARRLGERFSARTGVKVEIKAVYGENLKLQNPR